MSMNTVAESTYYPEDYRRLRRLGWLAINALAGARVLREAAEMGLETAWEDDWTFGSHRGECDSYEVEPQTCEHLSVYDSDNAFVWGLGCIDDADESYRRECEVEVLGEAIAMVKAREREENARRIAEAQERAAAERDFYARFSGSVREGAPLYGLTTEVLRTITALPTPD